MRILRPKNWYALILISGLAFPLLTGCGGGGGGGGGSNNGGGGNAGGPQTLSVVAPNGLTCTFTENVSTVATGGAVTYTLTATNNTAAAVTIQTGSATTPPVQLNITDPSGANVESTIPPPPFTTVSLAPTQSLTTVITPSVFNSAGAYKATATFGFSDGNPVTNVGPLTVTAH